MPNYPLFDEWIIVPPAGALPIFLELFIYLPGVGDVVFGVTRAGPADRDASVSDVRLKILSAQLDIVPLRSIQVEPDAVVFERALAWTRIYAAHSVGLTLKTRQP